MNRCRCIKELSSYLDSQLSGKRKIQIEEHLKRCALCSQELEKLKALSEKLKSWQAPALDVSFDSSVKNKIVALELEKERVKMNKKTLSILIPAGAIAGILIVSLLSLNVYMKRGVQGRFNDEVKEQYNAETEYGQLAYTPRPDGRVAVEQDKKLVNVRYIRAGKEMQVAEKSRAVGWQESSSFEESDAVGAYRSAGKRSGLAKTDSFLRSSSEQMPPASVSNMMLADKISPLAEDSRVIVIQPTLPATGIGDMIIRTAELTLEVENGKETYRKIADICREFGGYQAESSFSKNDQGREAGRVTLRIPKDKFLAALDKLSELGKVKANNTHSQDVSQDYANLKAELDAAMVVYNKMLEALQKRQTSITEAMRLESELTPVLKKIEHLKNQIEKLNNLASFTTVTVNFYEAEVSAKVLEETTKLVKENILAAKINAVRYFATHLPLVGLVAGFTLIAFVFVILLSILISRLKKRG